MRAKRATLTFWVNKKMLKNVQFGALKKIECNILSKFQTLWLLTFFKFDKILKLEFGFQSCAGVVISVLVASTLVSATQFLKALYMGGMSLDSHGLRPVSSSAFNNQETSRNLSSTKYYHHRATINQTSTVSRLMHLPSNTMYYLPSKWNFIKE